MYDYVFVTQLPAFYKVNLYNEIAKKCNVFVIFLGSTSFERAHDFVGDNMEFDYHFLNSGNFEDISPLRTAIKLYQLIRKTSYNKIAISGWNLIPFWVIALFMNKDKNCLVLESSSGESTTTGLKGYIKRLFLKRISLVFASGRSHEKLLKSLGFRGEIRITRGVGLINKGQMKPEFKALTYNNSYLFIGRMVDIKNIHQLVNIFKNNSNLHLTTIGQGPLFDELSNKKLPNINMIKHVENNELSKLFEKTNFLILPSLAEPWGLVVEEALFHGVPVIVSRESGSSELIIHGKNGFVFDAKNNQELESILLSIDDNKYQDIRKNIPSDFIDKKDERQVMTYLEVLN